MMQEMQDEIDYGKQRENKLMFFLFILKQQGYPISEVFEQDIKEIPTSRFSKNFDDEYKLMYEQIKKEKKKKAKQNKLSKFFEPEKEPQDQPSITIEDCIEINLGNSGSMSQFDQSKPSLFIENNLNLSVSARPMSPLSEWNFPFAQGNTRNNNLNRSLSNLT